MPKVSVAKAPTIFTGRGICVVRVPSPRMDAIPVRIAPIPRRISPKIRIDSSLHIRNTYIYKKAPN